MLRLAIREKDGYIQSLEGMMERNAKLDRKEERKTSHSLRMRMKT